MPPRDDDLTSASKAMITGFLATVLCGVIMPVSDLDKVDEFWNGTALQQALAAYFVCLTLSLFAVGALNILVVVYHLPPRFNRLRIIVTLMWFLYFFGAIYYEM